MRMVENKQFDCKRVAVFSDIHANLPAFRACYQDAKTQEQKDLFFWATILRIFMRPLKR